VAGIALLATILAGGSEPRVAVAQPEPTLEYQVKAAFLYQFLNFVEWPATAPGIADGMIIGVLGETALTSALQPLRGPRDLAAVHVLFVAGSEKERLSGILRTIRGASILTIGEVDGFTRLGGVINFVIVDGKVAFEINVRAAEEARLRISSKLLRLARIVEDKD
jgi:uncharacterized protein DUF4154